MVYTVKKISELSGVTIRALHFYEEIELLKPAYYGENGYRYYEEKQLLELQQILFFKELGFSLKQIQKVLGSSEFNQLAALYSHRKSLSREWEKIGKLIKTIDRTIEHVKGVKKMKDKEIFNGFDQFSRANSGASYFVAETIVLENMKNPPEKKHEKSYLEALEKKGKDIYRQMASCIEDGLDPSSSEVQELIKEHHAFTEEMHNATKKVYKALAQLYGAHPGFKKQLTAFHLKLPKFIDEAMQIFADRELS